MAVIDPLQIIDSLEGPAVRLDDCGRPVHANARGHEFMDALRAGACDSVELSILLAQVTLKRRAVSGRVRLNPAAQTLNQSFSEDETPHDPGQGAKTYDVLIVPCAGPGGDILLIAKDITADINLTAALTASRALYRDLVSCQADFAWETDSRGAFIYVNHRGAFGYSASELNGLRVTQLLKDPSVSADALEGATPFTPNAPVEEVEVWLKGKGGTDVCVLISAVPVFDKNNAWRGARGVGRDVTQLRRHEEEKRRNQKLNDAVAMVVNAMRNELDPVQIMSAAAEATLQASEAHVARIMRVDESGRFHVKADAAVCDRDALDLFSVSTALDNFLILFSDRLARGESQYTLTGGPWDLCGVVTRHQGKVNGALVVARRTSGALRDLQTPELLASIGAHAGIAIAQADQTERLQYLSSVDPLTGLLNRRAFMDLAVRRMEHHGRHGRPAGFIYIDVDNFKRINDEAGHRQGDKLLARIGEELKSCIRKSDLMVRLGGDEFGVFLEECSLDSIQSKADQILRLHSNLCVAPIPEGTGGLSLGLALFDPITNESLEHLIHRADSALYAAKLGGKNQWALAAPAVMVEDRKKDEVVTC